MSLTGRVAIVTGGGSGIGAAIAVRLAAEGALVTVVDYDPDGGQAVADRIKGHFVSADLRDRAKCHAIVGDTVQRCGRIDILVNNAGFQHVAPLQDFPEDAWDSLLALMLTTPFLLIKDAWPHMKEQGWGRIINISSIHGLVASSNKVGYISAKHGLIGLTRTAALEGGPHGITANAVCPGWTRTPLVENQLQDLARLQGIPFDDVLDQVGLAEAAIRRLIEPEEIAGLVAYLVSDAARSITGTTHVIDAGLTAH